MDEILFRAEKITLKRNGKIILDGIDWEIRRREHWALLGLNGSGNGDKGSDSAGVTILDHRKAK